MAAFASAARRWYGAFSASDMEPHFAATARMRSTCLGAVSFFKTSETKITYAEGARFFFGWDCFKAFFEGGGEPWVSV